MKTVEIQDFAKENDYMLAVKTRPKVYGKEQFYASFEGAEFVTKDHTLVSYCGYGKTIDEALKDYCKKISGLRICFNAYSDKRTEAVIPNLVHTPRVSIGLSPSNPSSIRFAVSIIFRKYSTDAAVGISQLATKIVSASSEQEAFGKAYDLCCLDPFISKDIESGEFGLIKKSVIPLEERRIEATTYKELRLSQRLTLRELEEKTGLSNAYLSQLENGKIKNPSYEAIQKLNAFYFKD